MSLWLMFVVNSVVNDITGSFFGEGTYKDI
jgi:hypothetical protein